MTSTATQPDLTGHPADNNVDGGISANFIADLNENFAANPTYRLAQNAVTTVTADNVALNRQIVTTLDHSFSHRLDSWKVTNQKSSGRCWMFAGLNLFRVNAMRQMNVEEFQFSQNYPFFWDKFERANYFLEAIIETAHEDIDNRTVAFLLDRPLDDGGQWNMFINIVKKHGLVPQAAMPETESSSNTRRMNSMLLAKLREGAKELRDLAASGADLSNLRAHKNILLTTIHRMLCIHLGTPPTEIDWQWQDKDKNFHRDGKITPKEFARKYVTTPIDDYVCLVHDPRESSPFNTTYTVKHLGNVVGGEIVKYLNIDIETMKKIAMDLIVDGEPVWMGCDVGKMMNRKLGLWDTNLFEYDTLYDTEFDLDKAGRLNYHQTLMTHAMLFTGVDVVDGKPRRWRVENSWGDKNGRDGYYAMNDSWFDEYMFEIAAPKSRLPESLQKALDDEPKVLPPWDPMGALAR